MASIIALFNQKGGVGKTTVAINLAAGLAKRKKKVLMVDLDPQSNTTSGFGIVRTTETISIYEVLSGFHPIEAAVLRDHEGVDVVPSSPNLAAASSELGLRDDAHFLLKEQLETQREYYDYILIDCPPALGMLTINALAACDSVIIPIQCEYYALEGLAQLLETLNMIRQGINPDIDIHGVLFNMVDKRNNLTRDVMEEVKEFFKDKVYHTQIPRNVRLAEAPSYGMSIFEYDPISTGAWHFGRWIKEFLKRSESHG